MRKLVTGMAAALALAATTIGAVAPAEAQWRGRGGYRGHYYRGDRTGAAVGAGILGLAVGAALASGSRGGGYGYYAPPPPPHYYAPPPPPSYVEYCRTDWRWDGYRGGYVPVRYCN